MNTKITPKDFFLHLGATVALFAAVIALINLSFSVINYFLPDQLAGSFYANSMAWPISVLIIVVPLLYILEYFISKDIKALPEKRTLWIRNWRIYLTLFLTGLTIIGDLIALINVYLNGEISSRFVYKIISVLAIAGIVFVYYLLSKTQDQVQVDNSKNRISQTIFAWLGLVIVLTAIVSGFIAVGSPNKQRNLRFDTQRVNDLNNIQWQIVSHWQRKGVLPSTLAELEDPISGYKIPADPKTKTAYEYSVKTPMSNTGLSSAYPTFELCATFALPTADNDNRGEYYGGGKILAVSSSYAGDYLGDNNNWKHEVGKACFERKIDPNKYPINEK